MDPGAKRSQTCRRCRSAAQRSRRHIGTAAAPAESAVLKPVGAVCTTAIHCHLLPAAAASAASPGRGRVEGDRRVRAGRRCAAERLRLRRVDRPRRPHRARPSPPAPEAAAPPATACRRVCAIAGRSAAGRRPPAAAPPAAARRRRAAGRRAAPAAAPAAPAPAETPGAPPSPPPKPLPKPSSPRWRRRPARGAAARTGAAAAEEGRHAAARRHRGAARRGRHGGPRDTVAGAWCAEMGATR